MYKNIFQKIFSKVFFFVFLFNLCFPISLNTTFAQAETTNTQNNTPQTTQPTTPRGSPNAEPSKKTEEPKSGCSIYTGWSIAGCIAAIADAVGGYILSWINWLLEGIITLASLALDFAVYSTIVEFKTNFAELGLNPNITTGSSAYTGVGTALFGAGKEGLIYYIWGMIRDFINIIIFITIIYHAVQSMFVGFQDTKNKFISLLVFSIIINFSLLFVQLAIDVSNILALQAYTLAVKPKNTSDFYQFRTSSEDPKSYGEYIFNSVDMDKLLSAKIGKQIAEAELKAMENTFFFQLGKFFVYIGIIYIFLFMTGLLFYRAVSFMFAMILAPLITLDVFFGYFGKGSVQMQGFAQEIRGKIGKYKGDFFEALVKGPLLIFFIYLVGVFAEAIFTQGTMDTLSNSLNRMPDVTQTGGAFVGSIGVFFKFLIFLILSKRVLEMVNEIDFKGSGRLSGWGRNFANYTLGRGIGGLGWAGRRISRPLATSKTGKAALDSLQRGSTALLRDKSFLSPITNRIGKAGSGLEKGLRGGSFDLRRLGMDKDGKLNSLGQNIKNASSALGISGIDLGKGAEGGFKTFDDKRKDKSKSRIDADIAAAVESRTEIQEDRDAAQQEKTSIGPVKNATLQEVDDLLKNQNFINFLENNQNGGLSPQIQIGGQPIQVNFTKDERDLFLGMKNGEMNEYKKKVEDDRETAIKKKVQQAKDDMKHEMEVEAAEGKRVGTFNILEKARDKVAGRKITGSSGAVAKAYQKAMLEHEKEDAKKVTIIKDSVDSVKNALQQADQILNSNFLTDPTEIADFYKLRNNLENDLARLQDPNNFFPLDSDSNSAKAHKLSNFKEDKDFREQIVKNKEKVADKIKSFFENGPQNDLRFNDLDAEIKNFETLTKAMKRTGNNPAAVRIREDQIRNMKAMLKNRNSTNVPERIKNSAKALKEKYDNMFEPKIDKKDDKGGH